MATVNIAFINELECIGCSKCIHVCPVDAIFGAAKHLHTVITQECIGCDLCVPACPVDCIIMLAPAVAVTQVARQTRAQQARTRIHARRLRLQKTTMPLLLATSAADKKAAIAAAITRVRAKKA